MTSKDKIQHLLITHLLKEGQIELSLPAGMKVGFGITAETKRGVEKCDDYCWMTASQDDKSISLDAHNLGLHFNKNRLVFNENVDDECILEVI